MVNGSKQYVITAVSGSDWWGALTPLSQSRKERHIPCIEFHFNRIRSLGFRNPLRMYEGSYVSRSFSPSIITNIQINYPLSNAEVKRVSTSISKNEKFKIFFLKYQSKLRPVFLTVKHRRYGCSPLDEAELSPSLSRWDIITTSSNNPPSSQITRPRIPRRREGSLQFWLPRRSAAMAGGR